MMPKILNVLFIADNTLSNPILTSQGLPHIVENSKHGIKYTILTFENPRLLKTDSFMKERYNTAFNMISSVAVHEYISLDFGSHPVLRNLRVAIVMFLGIFKTLWIVGTKKIDIIHGRGNYASFVGIIVKLFTGVKVIYDNRGLWSDEIKKNKFSIRVKIEKFIERSLYRFSNGIVFISEAFSRFIKNSNIKVKTSFQYIIPNAFSEERFPSVLNKRNEFRKTLGLDNRLVMVFSGPAEPWQRIDMVLSTFKELKSLRHDAFLLVVSYDKNMSSIIDGAGLNLSDYLVVQVPALEVYKYLLCGDFGVMFRDAEMRSIVCAPIKFAEYLACGLPVLQMDKIGDTQQLVREQKVGVVTSDEGIVTKKNLLNIIELSTDAGVKQHCVDVAHSYFSLKSAAKQYRELYYNLVSDKS